MERKMLKSFLKSINYSLISDDDFLGFRSNDDEMVDIKLPYNFYKVGGETSYVSITNSNNYSCMRTESLKTNASVGSNIAKYIYKTENDIGDYILSISSKNGEHFLADGDGILKSTFLGYYANDDFRELLVSVMGRQEYMIFRITKSLKLDIPSKVNVSGNGGVINREIDTCNVDELMEGLLYRFEDHIYEIGTLHSQLDVKKDYTFPIEQEISYLITHAHQNDYVDELLLTNQIKSKKILERKKNNK